MRLYLWFLLAYLSLSLVLTTGLTFLLPQKNLAYFLILGLFRLVALWFVYRHIRALSLPEAPKIIGVGRRIAPKMVFVLVMPVVGLVSYGLWAGTFTGPPSWYAWPILILVLLPAAFVEEITFRGRLFTAWAYEPGQSVYAICLSSVMFAGAHFSLITGIMPFFYYFIAPCVFALNKVFCRKAGISEAVALAINVIVHFCWNSALLLLGFGLSDITTDIIYLATPAAKTFDNSVLFAFLWLPSLFVLSYSHLTQCLKKSV